LDSLKRVQVSNRNTKRTTETRGKKDGKKMKNREERKGSNLEVLVDCDSLYGAIMHLFSLSWFLKMGKREPGWRGRSLGLERVAETHESGTAKPKVVQQVPTSEAQVTVLVWVGR
jgi:hypothetical protein